MTDVQRTFANGSLCQQFVQDYVSFVSIESPVSRIILTEKEKVLTFSGVVGTIGGTFGLFAGMSMLSFAEIVIFMVIFVHAMVLEMNSALLGKLLHWESYHDRILRTQSLVNVSNCLFLILMLQKITFAFVSVHVDEKK